MAGYKLEVQIIDAGDRSIKVGHMFYGVTEAECNAYFREHLASCTYFKSAEKEGRLQQVMWELDDDEELPTEDDPFPEVYEEEEEWEEEESPDYNG